MALSNSANVTKRIDVNRRLTFGEMDENFEQLKLSITDVGNLEIQLGDKVNTVVYDNKISEIDQSILDLENALVGTVSQEFVNGLESRISVNEDNILTLQGGLDDLINDTVTATTSTWSSQEITDVMQNNFKGDWSSLTGALSIPSTVKHNGVLWKLLNDVADVTTAEPSVSADWQQIDLPALTGNAELKLGVKADESGVEWQEVGGILSKYEEFTVSGTWTKDPAATWVYVECIGGGGGGDGGDVTSSGQSPGGRCGNYTSRLFRAEDLPETVPFIIGSGGSGGTGRKRAPESDGGDVIRTLGAEGGNTSFLELIGYGSGVVVPDYVLVYSPPSDSGQGGGFFINGPSNGGLGGGGGQANSTNPDQGGSQTQFLGGGGAVQPNLLQSNAFGLVDASSRVGGNGNAYEGGGGGAAAYNTSSQRGGALAAKGGSGGIGSGGGGGGHAYSYGGSVGDYSNSICTAGDGGDGGDGIIRIWQR